MLKGKKILLGITGSIAAYKSIVLTRLLVKAGAEVKIILTPAAKDFVTPLTLSTLSKSPVLIDIFNSEQWENHVMLGRWADVMLIAPLSCNTLSKMANGLCDNLLLAVYLSATCPVMVAPAMDEDMWLHEATQRNIVTMQNFGHVVLNVAKGELASGLTGEGRMAEPEEIITHLNNFFSRNTVLKNKCAIVTAGPTYEPLDPVRFIGNHSSGKMGIAIAKELQSRGARVHLILGPVSGNFTFNGMQVTKVDTAKQMHDACKEHFSDTDLFIMAAAVADYTPVETSVRKIKKNEEQFPVTLVKTTDILKSLGKSKKDGQVVVGFALETDNELDNAIGKLKSKNADMIVLNSLNDKGAGFSVDTNKITIIDKSGKQWHYETKDKKAVAKDIVNAVIENYYA